MQCACRRMEVEEEGKKCHVRVRRGMGGGLVGVMPLEGWPEPNESRRVPGLQMAWHCCREYDWHSLYCTTHTVLSSLNQPNESPHS